MSGSSQDFCSTCSPMQCWPPLLGAGLLQLRVLDLWPPEHDPQEDQQLQLPWITPEGNQQSFSFQFCLVKERSLDGTSSDPSGFYGWLPGCSPITAPFSHARPEVPGRQTQRHSEPVSSGWPLFWHGRQWQGCSSARYSSVALFRWSFFSPAHCTSLTSSYRGRSWKNPKGYKGLKNI